MAAKIRIDDLEGLTVDMQFRASEVIDRCSESGFMLKVYCARRTGSEQAKIFRQSRYLVDIEARAQSYRARGFDFLAEILIGVGPQQGKINAHLTNAGPGESWHQYGRAFDAVPCRGGKALWQIDWPEWQIYGDILAEVGLYWAGAWTRFKEYPHAQDTSAPNPLRVLGPNDVVDQLKSIERL